MVSGSAGVRWTDRTAAGQARWRVTTPPDRKREGAVCRGTDDELTSRYGWRRVDERIGK
jgi:hypothetical protein